MNSEKAHGFKTRDIALIAMMTAVIAVCSWISIPMTVPFTMQTFAVFAALLLLGGKRGTISIVLYIALGMIGLPVFAGFGSGAGHILGPTGGYIVGFVLTGIVYAAGEKHAGMKAKICLLTAGLLLCYIAGTLWFMAVSTDGKSFGTIVTVCVLPYILPDMAKLMLAAFVSKKIRRFGVV